MTNPIISYVIPCYNCEGSVADTVLSIKDTHEYVMATQGKESLWDKMEIILVDDGSTDFTWNIIKALELGHPNVRCFKNDGNHGRGYTRNKGNAEAKADIIAVLDADDLNIQDRTGQILKMFAADPDASIFYSSFLAHHIHLKMDVRKEAFPLDPEDIRKTGQFGICHSTVAYRKSAIIDHPYSDDKDNDDWFMLWQFFTHKMKFIYSNKPLVSYMIALKDIEKEFADGKQETVLEKKKKIMEPYFQSMESHNHSNKEKKV